MFILLLYLFLENKNQQSFFLVIFNLHKLDNNTSAVLEVRHPQYSPRIRTIASGKFIIDIFVYKTTTSVGLVL